VASRESLRPSEQKVCAVVIENPTWASRATLAEIATEAGVSEPSVVRFSRSLGFDGFQDFKYALIQSLASGVPAAHAAVERGDGIEVIANKIFENSLEGLRSTREALNLEALQAAVTAIRKADNLLVLGFGASGIVGQDTAQKFPLFGIPINAPVDFHQQFIAANLATSETVVLAISNTASTTEVLESVIEAKERGATTIAVCGKEGPISRVADIVISHTTEDTDIYTPTTSRLAALVIIDVLAVGVVLRYEPNRISELERMKSHLSRMRRGRRTQAETEAKADGKNPAAAGQSS
jgi:RpiR family carbohydrate utilization transcriptional regulator